MEKLSKKIEKKQSRPIKIMQFGEGNFLRAFVDYIISELNDNDGLDSSVAVIQPLPVGRIEDIKEQDGLYTLLNKGIENGEIVNRKKVIDVIDAYINPYTQYDEYLELAKSDDLQIVFSNTTEAGIVYSNEKIEDGICPSNFPAKLLAFLKARYEHSNGSRECGLHIVPCELIDYNGKALKEALVKTSRNQGYDEAFTNWITEANTFCSTLVDRIVPGYPRDDIDEVTKQLGYIDSSVVVGEPFHLWVIEDKGNIKELLKNDNSNLNIKFVDDLTPFKQRKVRVLNGAHTSIVPVSYFYGIDTVPDTMADEVVSNYLKDVIFNEIIPASNHILSDDELTKFANEVIERFENPYIRHQLLTISLNSTTKYKTRVLPSALDYIKKFDKLPKKMFFSLASMVVFFEGNRDGETYPTNDNAEFIEMYSRMWSEYDGTLDDAIKIAKEFLGMENHWEMDLNSVDGLTDYVANAIYDIKTNGMKKAIKKVM